MKDIDDSTLIDQIGGNVRIAEITGLTSQAISMWRKNGIPKAWKRVIKAELEKLRTESPQPDAARRLPAAQEAGEAP